MVNKDPPKKNICLKLKIFKWALSDTFCTVLQMGPLNSLICLCPMWENRLLWHILYHSDIACKKEYFFSK